MALALAAALASPALAGGRSPAELKEMLGLAYALGQAHALRQVCANGDQTWRERMRRMIEVEAPSSELEAQLNDRFNAGFVEARRRFPRCGPGAARAEAEAASEGRKHAEALAQSS
jgi:uncharacterized protein (TIGR02301 family)